MLTARILVVDDDPSVRTISRRILEHARYEVTEAESGKHAVDALRHGTFEAVVTDLGMPLGSGASLIQWVFLYRPEMRSRILVVSGDPKAKALVGFASRTEIPIISKPY